MIMTKIIGSILVIVSSTGIGFFYSNEMRCRVEDLKDLKKLIILLRGDIRYAKTPLPEAIHAIVRRHDGKFKAFFQTVAKRCNELSGTTLAEIWKDAVNKELAITSLTKKDKELLLHFGENLGYLDKDMQINTLDLYITQLEHEIEELVNSLKEKTYLYRSLGIMAGIFVCIVML